MKKVFLKPKGAFNYVVTISEDYENVGSFETKDMQLVADIQEMNDEGFEHELIMFDTFEEVMEYCYSKI